MKQFFILIPILAIAFNSEAQVKSYLALGDSYTICQSIDSTLRWPIQLANILNEKTTKVETPTIIAKTGWRTDDMLKAAEK
ncbi:MAG: acyl-CoA thioesterase-1, partial [Arenicella sp.]